MAQTITADMSIAEVLKVDRKLAKILLDNGMHCLGCPHAAAESLAEAGAVHGIEVDKMIHDLNSALSN
jgi:hybrid cluster-associated redox disulfide protein